MTGEIHAREQNTRFFHSQHFYKQHQVETGKKKAISAMINQNENENDKYTK